MKKLFLLSILYLLMADIILAQQKVTISTGPHWKDATVYRDTRSGYEYIANRNYGNFSRLSASAWTSSGSPIYWRSLMYFNLDTIPRGSEIISATLYFYSDPAITSTSAANGNSQLSGSNAFYLEKVIGEWHESTVTWNNQPATTTNGRRWVGASSSSTENRTIDIKSIVQEWVNNPISNSGLMMKLENELYYRSRNYASTDHPDIKIHPKLVIHYNTPLELVADYSCGTPDPSEEEYMNIPWYGNETYLENFYDSLQQVQNNQRINDRLHPGDIETPWLRVPVKFWVYQINAGNPGGNAGNFPNERRFQRMMDDLNNASRANRINLRFYLERVEFVSDERGIEVGGFREQLELVKDYHDDNAVNIHVVDQIENNLYNPIYNAIFIRRWIGVSEEATSTFTHEVAHYFGVFHTDMFSGIPCLREPVSRGTKWTACPNGFGSSQRCAYTGDLLCDTQADPNMRAVGEFNGPPDCIWNSQGERDFYGDPYSPDPLNYMASGNHPCRSNFSTGQRNVMYFFAFLRQKRPSWDPVIENRFDRFEPDDASIAARDINFGIPQTHSFHEQGRRDNVDWLRFVHNGTMGNYLLKITELDASAVGSVNIFLGDNNGNATASVSGISSVRDGSTETFTIPCASLNAGDVYLIEITRGNAGTVEYEVEFSQENPYTDDPLIISGSTNICNGSSVKYSFPDLGSGTSYDWSVSNGLQIVSGQGTNEIMVRPTTAGGTGTVSLSIATSGGCPFIAPIHNVEWEQVQLQGYYSSLEGQFTLYGINYAAADRMIVNMTTSGTNWSWRLISGSTLWHSSGPNLEFNLSPGAQVTFEVSANVSPCGTITRQFTFVESGGSGPIKPYSIYPNPASDELTISQEETSDGSFTVSSGEAVEVEDEEDEFTVALFNKNGDKILTGKSNKKKLKLNVKKLKNDLYYLNLKYGEEVSWHQVMIKRE